MIQKAVLFDLDGTLLDTLDDLADSMNHALVAHGLPPHDVDAYRTLVGDGVAALVRRVAPAAREDDDLARTLLAKMADEYSRRWADKTKPYDGVAETLDGLCRRRLPMAVLSNKPHGFTKQCVAGLLGQWRFDVVQGVDDSTPPKPDTAAALRIAGQLGATPAEVVYVGDTNTDMKTATAAGMFAVGALWGFRSADELRRSGADMLIEHPTELLHLVDAAR